MIIGVLALQGAFREHMEMLKKIEIKAIEIKYPEQLDMVDGLIIPGGESGVMGLISKYKLNENNNSMIDAIREFKKPIWGTCAGLIMLSSDIIDQKQERLSMVNCQVKRNFFGAQINSFIEEIEYPKVFNKVGTFPAVFIRAPVITKIYDTNIDILLKKDEGIIAAKTNRILLTSFHPELTEDCTWHEFFIEMVKEF